jgi:hypothetical protein
MSRNVAGFVLAISVTGVSAYAQTPLAELLQRHGVQVKDGGFDVAFDTHAAPTVAVTPGSFATPMALLRASSGSEQIAAAYAFGILAGRSGSAASPQERAAAGQSLVMMIGSRDRRSRIAGARVAGRVFAAPWGPDTPRPAPPAGLLDGLFAMLNQDSEIDQLAAMDALGLTRQTSAFTSLVERYRFYRTRNKRALAGGALEAVTRIGVDPSIALARELVGDPWANGRDATALAVAFARERLLKDGSIAAIRQALDDKSRRHQARGYLAELGASVP